MAIRKSKIHNAEEKVRATLSSIPTVPTNLLKVATTRSCCTFSCLLPSSLCSFLAAPNPVLGHPRDLANAAPAFLPKHHHMHVAEQEPSAWLRRERKEDGE